jgi:hypothetical protein
MSMLEYKPRKKAGIGQKSSDQMYPLEDVLDLATLAPRCRKA